MVNNEKHDPLMLARQLPLKSVALILAGGRGSRLKDLTARRAKPAVHFGGKFRIIDFALSNCLNSGIRRIGVITQYQSHTLVQHIQRGWSFLNAEMNLSIFCQRNSDRRPTTGIAARRMPSVKTSTFFDAIVRNTW